MNAQLTKVFNDTTAVGKSGKVFAWSGLACIVLAALTTITGNPTLFTWHSGVLVVIANVLLVLIKNMLDTNTPNI